MIWSCWQRELDGDVTLCCAAMTGRPSVPLKCGGAAGICQNLYDSAPSGRYGTMSYLCRSVVQCLSMPTAADGNLDCVIQWSPKHLCHVVVFRCCFSLFSSSFLDILRTQSCWDVLHALHRYNILCVQIVLLAFAEHCVSLYLAQGCICWGFDPCTKWLTPS